MATCGDCGGRGRWMGLHWNDCKPCSGTGQMPDPYGDGLLFVPDVRLGGLPYEVVTDHMLAWRFDWLDIDLSGGTLCVDNRLDLSKTSNDGFTLRFAQAVTALDEDEAWRAAKSGGFAPATLWHGMELLHLLDRWPHVTRYVFLGTVFMQFGHCGNVAIIHDGRGTGLTSYADETLPARDTVYVMIEQPGDPT